ncbi:type II secretion system protein [Nocardioides sp. WS12]|uniref:type IV pilus modification PilV family protein n=1 Tax=Nocardioides sp. WS12 TaxID=2486272 RepID=UPI0015FB0CEE|nr:type II secretion system protein [Nocardioides sp. WS12]
MLSPRDTRSDAGATLVEVLVSLIILSTAGLAVMAGLQMSILTSDIHRKQSTGGAYVRSYAEAIEKYLNTNGNYVKCAGADAYNVNAVLTELDGLPSNFTPHHAAAAPIAGDGSVITTGSCPSRDTGVQRLRLTMVSNDGRGTERLTIVVRRICDTGTACD